MADACPALADEDVGKSAGLAPDVPARAASSHLATAAVQALAAAPCTRAAARSEEQSCAAPVSWVAAVQQPRGAPVLQESMRWPEALQQRAHSGAQPEGALRRFVAVPRAHSSMQAALL
jgi:hypothetical protein